MDSVQQTRATAAYTHTRVRTRIRTRTHVSIEMESTLSKARRNLDTMYRYYKSKGDGFRAKHYKASLDAMKNMTSLSKEDVEQVAKGDGLRRKLLLLIETGDDFADLVKVNGDDKILAQMELERIHGIGPSKARSLVSDHRVESVLDLRERVRKKEIELTSAQTAGLRYFDDFNTSIPRTEMHKHAERMVELIAPLSVFYIAGSYRREKSTSNDIDVLLTGNRNELANVVSALKKSGYLLNDAELAHGDLKYMGGCRLPRHKYVRRIDIMYTTPEEFPYAYMYFTGSAKFNTDVRQLAIDKGYSLNEKGLFRDGDRVAAHIRTEDDIFRFMEIPYVSPSKR